jgi:DNA-binding NarL/FixJ family response regulator
MDNHPTIRIILFEDNDALRQSLKLLLETDESCQIVGDFNMCTNAKAQTKDLQPDVVIMDIDMPSMTGIEGVRLVKEAKPDTEIIMNTVFEDDDRLFASFCAGATGYLLKKHSNQRILSAVHDVIQGGTPLSPGIARRVLGFFQKKNVDYKLTPREIEILSWLVKGYSYKMIAETCFLSIETIKTHLKNIYAKLHVSCATEAVAKALREGII